MSGSCSDINEDNVEQNLARTCSKIVIVIVGCSVREKNEYDQNTDDIADVATTCLTYIEQFAVSETGKDILSFVLIFV